MRIRDFAGDILGHAVIVKVIYMVAHEALAGLKIVCTCRRNKSIEGIDNRVRTHILVFELPDAELGLVKVARNMRVPDKKVLARALST
jgi:hypothetical protein